jgi:hypothetical protein
MFEMVFLGINYKWQLHVGDPDIWSWLITLQYFVCVFLAFYTLNKYRNHADGSLLSQRVFLYVLVFFGFNKQLDLQVLLNDYAGHLLNVYNLRPYKIKIIALGVILAFVSVSYILRRLIKNREGNDFLNFYIKSSSALLVIFVLLKIAVIYKGEVISKVFILGDDVFLKSLESMSLIIMLYGQYTYIKHLRSEQGV